MRRLLIPLACLIAALGGPACLPVGVDADACSTSADCDNGLVCEASHCIAAGANAIALSARILPPSTSSLLEQHVPDLSLSTGPAVTVTLVEPVTLYGTVDRAQDPQPTEGGDIDARAEGDIAGFNYRFSAPALEGLTESGIGYELLLLPGRDYEVTFRPADTALPPHTFLLEAADVVEGQFDIPLPAVSEHSMFKGIVRWQSGEAIPDAEVTVLLSGGRALPTRLSGPNGHFEALVPPGSGSVSVRVDAPEAGPLFPQFEVAEVPVDPNPVWDDVVASALEIPNLPAGYGPFEARVSVHAPIGGGAAGEAMVGVPVNLYGHLEGGVLHRTAITGVDGVATFDALPGAWEILLAMPLDSLFESAVHKVNLQLDESGAPPDMVELVVAVRPTLTLDIADAYGAPVVDGVVEATRRPDAAEDQALTLSGFSVSADLDEGGVAVLALDSGTYDVRVEPSSSTGAPAMTMTGVVVAATTSFTVPLPEPGLALVTVVTAAGEALPNATVELYAAAPASQATAGDRPPVLHEGVTDVEGAVGLLVPFVP